MEVEPYLVLANIFEKNKVILFFKDELPSIRIQVISPIRMENCTYYISSENHGTCVEISKYINLGYRSINIIEELTTYRLEQHDHKQSSQE
jgi:hypothetical protein